jgi:anti-sigma regulatory factor (Ser/Thr protein kinase)
MPEIQSEPRQPIYLMLRMKPPWVFIDEIRRFVESFCACACDVAVNRESQLALAVHELMQNAVPFSHDEEVDLVLEVDPDADRVAVAVTNRCTEAEFQSLKERIERMNSEPDALRHYLAEMSTTPATVRGGLGLARVRFEAQLELSLSRSGGRVTVHASGALRAPALKVPGGAHV